MSVRVDAAPTTQPLTVGIVTPTLNAARHLQECAASILSQQPAGGSPPFTLRWIVVDGGSTDGTLPFLDGINDPRLTVLRNIPGGQSAAINVGMRELATSAPCDILSWLNADDLYEPGAIAAMCKAFVENPSISWLVGRCAIINDEGQPIRPAISAYKWKHLLRNQRSTLLRGTNYIPQPAVFWRSSLSSNVAPRGDLLDESLHYTMDYDLWLRLSAIAPPLVLDAPIARFRLHAASKTGAVKFAQFSEQYAVATRSPRVTRLDLLLHRLTTVKIYAAYRLLKLLGR